LIAYAGLCVAEEGGDNGGRNNHGGGDGGKGDHHEEGGFPFCNLTTAWQECVNHTFPCLCYAPECPQNIGNNIVGESLTVEKAIVEEYNRILLSLNYPAAYAFFSPNILVTVPYFDISFSGAGANVAYLYLGDPDISDEYVILGSVIEVMLQQGLQVFTKLNVTYQNVHTDVIWTTTNIWLFTFAENHTVIEINIYVDSLGTIQNLLSTGTINLDPTTLCEDIMTDCTGSNLQYGGEVATCVAFMETLTVEVYGQIANGNTLFCRSWHEVLARSDPNIHCEHTGPLKINPTLTPCNNF